MLVGVLQICKKVKGNRENIPSIKDYNGRIITDSIDKPIILIPIIRQSLAARATFRVCRAKTQENRSLLTLK